MSLFQSHHVVNQSFSPKVDKKIVHIIFLLQNTCLFFSIDLPSSSPSGPEQGAAGTGPSKPSSWSDSMPSAGTMMAQAPWQQNDATWDAGGLLMSISEHLSDFPLRLGRFSNSAASWGRVHFAGKNCATFLLVLKLCPKLGEDFGLSPKLEQS